MCVLKFANGTRAGDGGHNGRPPTAPALDQRHTASASCLLCPHCPHCLLCSHLQAPHSNVAPTALALPLPRDPLVGQDLAVPLPL